ncbi:MAG: hypothetical protein WB783_21135 [Arenicellales bacterium]
MLTKILLTVAVVLAVMTYYRVKNSGRVSAAARRAEAQAAAAASQFGRRVAYAFVAGLLLLSAVLYGLHWREQHRIMTIHVIGDNGTATYKAYKKDVKDGGKRFRSLDGKTVILGSSEREEIIGTQ